MSGSVNPNLYSLDVNVDNLRGPFSPGEVDAFLDTALIPMRIAAVGQNGWPLVLSLWFLRDGDELLAATRPTSMLVAYLTQMPKCGFEIAGDEFAGVFWAVHASKMKDQIGRGNGSSELLGGGATVGLVDLKVGLRL